MNPSDFVYDQIFKGAIRQGTKQDSAHRHAVMGLDELKKGKMGGARASKLIERHIAEAKREK